MTEAKSPYYGGEFKLTSEFGERFLNGQREFHGGIDLVGISSKRVTAVSAGRVIFSGIITDKSNRTSEWGNYVSVMGDDGKTVYYCHLSKRSVASGDRVEIGDEIGVEGNTGYSFGSHLHLEVRQGRAQENAAEYIGIEGSVGRYKIKAEAYEEYIDKIATAVGFDDKLSAVGAMKRLSHPYKNDFWRKIWEWGAKEGR